MTDKYILDGHTPVLENDTIKWGRWIEENQDKKRVAETTMPDGTWVSTVFLGLNHRFFPDDGAPLLFETMVFPNGEHGKLIESYCGRYSTWEEAEAGHNRVVEALKNGRDPADTDS